MHIVNPRTMTRKLKIGLKRSFQILKLIQGMNIHLNGIHVMKNKAEKEK